MSPSLTSTSKPSTTRTVITLLVAPLIAASAIAATAATAIAIRPTIAEFIAQADPICARADREIGKLKIDGSMLKMKTSAVRLGVVTANTAVELRGLSRPSSSDLSAAIDQMARAGSRAKAFSVAAANRDFPGTAKAATEMSSAFASADDLSRRIGLRECGRTASRVASAGAQGAPPLLKGAYLNDANGLCRVAFSKLGPEPTTLPEVSASMKSLYTIGTALNAKLRAIAPPPSEKAVVAGVFKSFDTVVTSAKGVADATDRFIGEDYSGLAVESGAAADLESRTIRFLADTAAANIKADQYGLKDCGSGTQ